MNIFQAFVTAKINNQINKYFEKVENRCHELGVSAQANIATSKRNNEAKADLQFAIDQRLQWLSEIQREAKKIQSKLDKTNLIAMEESFINID